MKTKSIQEMEAKMEGLKPESLRFQVLKAVKQFKGNWLELARYVTIVEDNQSFKEWGFASFQSYCTRELKLREQTVAKLLRSYLFLKKEEPDFLSSALAEGEGPQNLPDFESVDILRKARRRKDFPREGYDRMRTAVFQAEAEPRELGKQFRSLLESARETSVDPDQAWERRREATVRRVLASLKSIRQNLEAEQFLSRKIVEGLAGLIRQIEDEVTDESATGDNE